MCVKLALEDLECKCQVTQGGRAIVGIWKLMRDQSTDTTEVQLGGP